MFNPKLDTTLDFDGRQYRFVPHPAAPMMVWGAEGRHAVVYRIESNGNGAGHKAWALKVFRPAFRHAGLIEAAETLAWYKELPGMSVCAQRVITAETHPALVKLHEDLDFAMLMPWIEGKTWFDYLERRDNLLPDQSRALAESIAWVLYALELNEIAHCDLSSGNVIIDPALDQVNLIDVEDLYSPWLTPPPFIPAGSPGYGHRAIAERGQWGPVGDRFSGALLVAEMLAWADQRVRSAAWGESYFAPKELFDPESERFKTLRKTLRVYNPGFAEAFEQAWRSQSLDDCPPLKTWYDLLDSLPRDPVIEWAAIDRKAWGLVSENKPKKSRAGKSSAAATAPAAAPAAAPPTKQSPIEWLKKLALGVGIGCNVLIVLGCIAGFLALFLIVALAANGN